MAQRLQAAHGDRPPETLTEELHLARAVLATLWRSPAPAVRGGGENRKRQEAHVLIGAPGVGKTTCLCKWLVQSVLMEGCSAQVWRLVS